MAEIIIVQTSKDGFISTQKAINEMGLAEKTVVLGSFNIEYIRGLLDPDRRQLFISGTIHGRRELVVDFVAELRREFPKLTCLSFTTFDLPSPPFNGSINKWDRRGPYQSFKEAIERFLGVPIPYIQ